jgi:hypothetical protein
MSAVVEFVSNVVEDVVEAVGDAVETVVETVETTIKAVAENPEILIIAVVAPQILPAIGVPAIAVQPVTAALISASQGGDIEDIGKAALTAYVAPQVANRVGGAVAIATEGSSLQNALASAAGSAAGAATGAAITGGDIGTAALTGAAAGAGASIGREVGAAAEYGTTPFSQQTQDIISQETLPQVGNINPFSNLAADIGSALGRGAVTGEVDLAGLATRVGVREIGNELREAFASSPGAPETQKATEIIAAEMDANPGFQEQLQIAQIANGDIPLSVDQQIDALAEAIAREEFDAAATGEQVAALPAVALPMAINATARAAQAAAPAVVQRIAQFAANDPRFAQVIVTNNYIQRLLAASGVTVTVVGSVAGPGLAVGPGPHIRIDPVVRPDESPAEIARLNRYAAEIARSLPNPEPGNVQRLDNSARLQDLNVQRQDLSNLQNQGFPVAPQIERIDRQIQDISTQVNVPPNIGDFPQGEPTPEFPEIPGLPRPERPPTPDIVPFTTPVRTPVRIPPGRETTPGRTPAPGRETTPGPNRIPGTTPEAPPNPADVPSPNAPPIPGTSPQPSPDRAPQPSPRTETAPQPGPRPQPGTQPTGPRPPAGPGTPPRIADQPRTGEEAIIEEPVNIEDLFTDEDILEFIREGLGEDFVDETMTDTTEVETANDGTMPPVIDIRGGAPSTTTTPYRSTVTSRAVGSGPGAVTGRKEPMFGGDPGAQQDVWNVRSLRLRKALGL